MKKLPLIALIALASCQMSDSSNSAIEGDWTARWETDPAAYGDLAESMSFVMDGKFEFEENAVTISAYGYDGCIFGVDTLSHTLNWVLSSDTLELQNSAGEPGIQYRVLEQTDSKIKLQLVDDIFITLTK